MDNIDNKEGYVNYQISNNTGIITLYHPKSNSLPGALLQTIAAYINDLGSNDAVKTIIIKSEGEKTFCAGASFDELLTIDTPEKGKTYFMGFANIINAARKCPKIIIARVQGKAVGGGVGLASAADYCLAMENASVKLSELGIGIGPFVVGPAVERKIGKSAFCQLAVNASEWHSASWAKEKGLYHEIHKTFQQLDDAISLLSAKLTSYNPEAMTMLKKVLWEGTEHWDDFLEKRAVISGNLILSDFVKNYLKKLKS